MKSFIQAACASHFTFILSDSKTSNSLVIIIITFIMTSHFNNPQQHIIGLTRSGICQIITSPGLNAPESQANR